MTQISRDTTKTSLKFWVLTLATAVIATPAIGYFFCGEVYNRDPDVIGDYLAGAFSPLAFLWLIAAVFLQKQELEAQRYELRQTREIAEKNVGYIEEQTKILSYQRVQAEQDYTDRQIDEFIYQIDSLFSRIAAKAVLEYRADGLPYKISPIAKKDDETPAQYIMGAVAQFEKGIAKFVQGRHFKTPQLQENLEIKKHFTLKLASIVSSMKEVNRLTKKASSSKRALVHSLDFDRMFRGYELYRNLPTSP